MATQQTILVIEDEDDLRHIIVYNLEKEGYATCQADSGESGLQLAQDNMPDLILLDLMLPGINGLDVCKQLKQDTTTAHIPVVMVSAKDDEIDVVMGLEMGAEDYVAKPFSPRVLLARIRAVLRRSQQVAPPQKSLSIEGLTINVQKYQVSVDGELVEMTKSEFNMLYFLAENKGWVYTRFQIVNAIRGDHYIVTERAVDVLIAGLRKKLKPYAHLIETIRGVGYRFKE